MIDRTCVASPSSTLLTKASSPLLPSIPFPPHILFAFPFLVLFLWELLFLLFPWRLLKDLSQLRCILLFIYHSPLCSFSFTR